MQPTAATVDETMALYIKTLKLAALIPPYPPEPTESVSRESI